eukprot:Gregarina_sp_Poly_1__2731@NODE_1754_length_3404_cov_98_094996_g491_i1_p1_GENE_NODE_1754_length_3404_cov_98_094996_g491_i1NODE_1754_length_3404_cov_98_094996_g491_i1_p1_ORF_typecomplete_len346_score52_86RRM_1/PF00076_22/1_6RRM_1/PF00076_22/1_6e18RRM_7/PF16367_5/4_9e02RRM_7/PF16367_5/2e06RRM_2/PF04059_12/1_2e02RRM_2/PF04059_12/0_16RRM_5/PF13893_6/0_016RNA_bind/PF08675_11/1_8e04RNA_bind/PF08675_11/1_3e02RNA_bind/PF08675_11/0_17RRM_Rrp7/PF17799_1/0_16RRM_Rrp7/PF17799_1/45Nup35_RRM_2/PF14605_6/0_032_
MVYERGGLARAVFGLPPTKETAELLINEENKSVVETEVLPKTNEKRKRTEEPSRQTKPAKKSKRDHVQDTSTLTIDSQPPESEDSDHIEATPDGSNATRSEEELRLTVCLKNLPVNARPRHIYKFLNLEKAEVQSMRFRNVQVEQKFSNNKLGGIISKSFIKDAKQTCYVVLKDTSSISKCLLLNGTPWIKEGHIILVDQPPLHKKFSLYDKRSTVFVGRLPKHVDENKLIEWFGNIGKILHVRIVRDPKNQVSQGFGFVCFENKSAVPQAIKKFAKFEIDGHPLRVTRPLGEVEAQDLKDRKSAKKPRELKVKESKKATKKEFAKDKLKRGAARRLSQKLTTKG